MRILGKGEIVQGLYAILQQVTILNRNMSKNPPLSPEDLALFQAEMRHVTPLKTSEPKHHAPRPNPPPIRKKVPVLLEPPAQQWDLSDYYADPVQSESLLNYHQAGVSKAQIHALKTGSLHYQAKLDLHGLKADIAKDRLCDFLNRQVQAQHRWVLIIHGKGGRFGEAPVLKNLVNHWLKQIPSVLAYHSAHPKHGGTGAVYVLLKNLDNY
jgi:DNA-nicking Smr family endonuclease